MIGISFLGGAIENAQITPTTTCPRPLGAKGKCLREQNGPFWLVDEADEKLQCPPSPNGFVFADELGWPMNRKSNNRTLRACSERTGVRALAVNNLRHSFASQHLTAGTPVLEVSKLMGHSDPSVTLKVYSRWAE